MAAMQVPGPSRTTQEIATMSLWNKEALKSMRQELGRVNMDVVMIKELEKSDVPSPGNKGFLSRGQLQVVESKTTPAEQMKMVINYLLEMEDKYFEDFCTILEQSNFAGKAKMLREKAQECKAYLEGEQYYPFRLLEGGEFGEGYGIMEVDAHCSLFGQAFRLEDTSRYYASLWEREEGNILHSKVAVTFESNVWMRILSNHWPGWKKRFTVSFQMKEDHIESCLNEDSGRGWRAVCVGPNWVGPRDIEYVKKYKSDVKELQYAVAAHLYPPAICYDVVQSEVPRHLQSHKCIHLHVHGTKEGHITIPLDVLEEKEATMHPWNKEALKSMRQELGRVEMDVVMIKKLEKSDMPSPANLGFLSREQLQVVESKVTPAAQMNKVIEYLVEMEDKYFEDFCTILEQSNYAGKAKMLRERADVLKKRSVATMSPWNKEALKSMREGLGGVNMEVVMIKKLEKSYVSNRANLGFLSHEQLQVVESKTTPAGQMNKVIDYLLEMEDKYFENFCTILEQSNFEGRAIMLRKKAEDLKRSVDLVTDKQEMEEAQARATADFKKSLEAALAKGSVEVEMVKCVTLGPTEAGKTQLKYALIGKFDHSSESTPVSTGSEVVVQRYVSGESTWEPLTRERLLKSLKTTVKEITESTEANSSTQKNEAEAVGVERKKVKPPKTRMHKRTGVHEDTTGASGQRADSKKTLRSQFATIKASVEAELREAGTAEVKSLDKVRIIHMVDSGGQPAFFDIHPVIATSRAVYLLVYNMEKGLDHKPAITYRKKAFPTKQLENTKQSNVDMIKSSLLTLHDCKQKFTALEKELHLWFGESISKSADGLPVLVVGTRKRKESIPREYETLEKECSYLPLWKKVLHSKDTGRKLFAVESTDQNCQGVQSVRQEVDQAGCIFKLPLPVSWFFCQLIFLSVDENLHVLTFSNLQDLCQQEGLISGPDEFLAMVRTFHLLGIFSFPYLEQELTLRDEWRPDDKPVFTNPDVLYQEVTKILEIAYRDLAQTRMEPEARESLTALQSTGRLDLDALRYLGIPDDLGFYSGFHAYLLERLVHWGLAGKPISEGAIVTGRAALFIPSVLPACDKEPVICNEYPLSFTFSLSLDGDKKVHYVPRGIFPHLVVHIEGLGYVILENMEYRNYLFRDVALFSIEPSCSNTMQYAYNMMMVDKMNHVTISIVPAHKSKEKSCPADCRQIVNDFKLAMEATYLRIYHSALEVTLASECTCKRPGTPALHLARIHCEDGHCKMQCLLPLIPFWYDCPPKLAALLCDQASSFSASRFLKTYEDEFVEVVDTKRSLLKLKLKGVISADVKTVIEDANDEEAKYLLLEHLQKNATVGTLSEFCEVAIAANGFPRMQELGRKMMNALPPEEGEPSLRKRSPESALQDQPPAKTVVRCDLTGSERSVDAVGVSSSAPVVSRGAVAAERSPPICEAGQPLAKRVLMECQTHFLEVVAVKDIYRELCQKHVIHQTVADKITHSHSVEEARGHLFDHMRDYGTLATLKVFCDVISSDKYNGFRAMQDFGAELRRRLVQEGEPSLRKRSSESALQHQPPAKTVVRCDLTGSERSVEAVGVSSSAPVVSRGAVAAERSPPICEGEHSQRKRSPEGAQQDQPPAKTVVRCNLTESEGSVEVVDVSGSAPAVSRGADAAESGPPICEATPPTHSEGAAQTETNPAAGSSMFAIITANPTEQSAVRHFLQLGKGRGEVWEDARDCIWKKDPYLKSNNVTVTDIGLLEEGYEVFTLTIEGRSTKVVGVHIKCLQQASYTEGGALETTTTLLQHASKWKLQLTDIFSVGCCGYAHDGKSEENLMGYVLLTHEHEAYLNRGKMVKGGPQHHPEVYKADQIWISDLQDHCITKPARQSGSDAQAPVKFKDIPVKEVPRNESGPFVIKSTKYADDIRGSSYRSMMEMEAIGCIKALHLWKNVEKVPQFALVKGVSDFGSGKDGDAKTTFFGEETPALSDDKRQLVATLHSIALVIRGVVERYLVPHKVANFEQLL